MKSWTTTIIAGLAAGMLVSAAQAEVFVYPKPGQSQDAFQKDQYECHNWATQQTGFNPAAPPQTAAAPPPQHGGAVRGAARGAAVGAVGGGVGATAGVMRQNANNRAAAQASQQAQAQQQAAYGNYERAYAACLGGRGYTVK
jgi:hypothetical protein